MSKPITMGIAAGVTSFLASAITSQIIRGDLNVVPALVGGVVFGLVFGGFAQWQTNKKSPARSDDASD